MDVSAESFETAVIERSRELPVIVDFWAPWCGPCHALAPVLEQEVERRGGAVELVKVNVDESPELASRYAVSGIPSVKAFSGRRCRQPVRRRDATRSRQRLPRRDRGRGRMSEQSTGGLPHPLPEMLVELIARRFHVIGEPMRIRLLDQLRDERGIGARARRGHRCFAAERLQAPRCPARGRDRRPTQGRNPGLLPGRRRRRVRALRVGLRQRAATGTGAERDPGRGRKMSGWPLERVLFAMAGTMTLATVALARARVAVVAAADRVRRGQPVDVRVRRAMPRLRRDRAPLRRATRMPQVIGHPAGRPQVGRSGPRWAFSRPFPPSTTAGGARRRHAT